MSNTSKICPITKEKCDPLSNDPEKSSNLNCTFFVQDMFSSKCIYLEALKAVPNISEALKRIKNHV